VPDQPIIAQKAPYGIDVEAGKSYWWCSCGLSKNQPLCDGSHKSTHLTPLEYKAEVSEKIWLCGCKQTSRKPGCDGSHKQL